MKEAFVAAAKQSNSEKPEPDAEKSKPVTAGIPVPPKADSPYASAKLEQESVSDENAPYPPGELKAAFVDPATKENAESVPRAPVRLIHPTEGYMHESVSGPLEPVDPLDWRCTECGANQYSEQKVCKKCEAWVCPGCH